MYEIHNIILKVDKKLGPHFLTLKFSTLQFLLLTFLTRKKSKKFKFSKKILQCVPYNSSSQEFPGLMR